MRPELMTVLTQLQDKIDEIREMSVISEAEQPRATRDEVIRQLHSLGMTREAVAKLLGVSVTTVSSAIKHKEYRCDWPRLYKILRSKKNPIMKRANARDWSLAIEAYSNGESTIRELAELYGVSYQRVQQVMDRSGANEILKQRLREKEQKALELLKDVKISEKEVHDVTGVPIGTLKRLIREAGLTETRKEHRTDSARKEHPRTDKYDADFLAYQKGAISVQEIAEKHGVTTSAVYTALRTRGIPCTGRGKYGERNQEWRRYQRCVTREKILRLYIEEKLRPAIIADRLGIGSRTVYHHLKEARKREELKEADEQ